MSPNYTIQVQVQSYLFLLIILILIPESLSSFRFRCRELNEATIWSLWPTLLSPSILIITLQSGSHSEDSIQDSSRSLWNLDHVLWSHNALQFLWIWWTTDPISLAKWGLCPVHRGTTFAEEERSSGAWDLLGSAVPLPYLLAGDRIEERGNQADVMGDLSVLWGE